MIDRLVVATQNPDKLAEIEAVLIDSGLVGEVAQGLSWPEIEETEPTLEGNARLKACTVSELTGLPALADDTGLEVAALGGAPGVRTARFSGPGATYASNRAALLAALDGVTDRSAVFRTVVCVAWPDGGEVVATGELEGSITEVERGGGFRLRPGLRGGGPHPRRVGPRGQAPLQPPHPGDTGVGQGARTSVVKCGRWESNPHGLSPTGS